MKLILGKRKLIGNLIMTFSIVCFIVTILFPILGPFIPFPSKLEFPLGEINSIIIIDNSIYLSDIIYGRIHMYNTNGKFVKSWPVPCYMRAFDIIKVANNVYAIISPLNRVCKYSNEGKLYHCDYVNDNVIKNYLNNSSNNSYDKNGVLYEINPNIWSTLWKQSVIKYDNAYYSNIICNSYYIWIFRFPMPAIVIFVLGIFIAYFKIK